ncbi:MFS transporter [Paenibacillus caui]|uniref:MFS transporter n=1 Tax=Paenibacillus caui TaxID=2873927 RepID=UPI001F3FCEB8|nr:MFS transporter [Paenibacillus caui]
MTDSQISVGKQLDAAVHRLPALWRNKQYILLLFAHTFSIFGNSFHNIALNLWILNKTGSARMMTVVLVMNLVLGSVFGPIAGTLADRMNRRHLMLLSDLSRCGLALMTAFFITIPGTSFMMIVCLTGLSTVFGLFHSPAFQSSLITIVGKDHIERAVGLMNISENISRTAGFTVGGIFVAAFGGAWTILFDGLTFLLTFFLVILAGSFPSPRKREQHKKKFKEDFITGLKFIWKDPFAKAVTILSPTLMLFFMSSLMLTQVIAVKVWTATPFQFGLMESCIPAGYMLGAGMIVVLGPRLKHRGKLVVLNLVLIGPGYMLLSYCRFAYIAIPMILLIGFMFSLCTLLINIILRLEVSDELQGRVFGTLGSLMSIAPSVGLVVVSFFADLFAPNAVMFVIGCLLLVFGCTAGVRLKTIREYD